MGEFASFPSRIVCVEDNVDLREVIKISLQLSGEDYIFVGCSDGQEIINRIRELQPDLMILDLSLPDMTGVDVLEQLRSELQDLKTKVLILTGHVQVEMNDGYRRLGVVDVIHKPFDPDGLVQAVAAASEMDISDDFLSS